MTVGADWAGSTSVAGRPGSAAASANHMSSPVPAGTAVASSRTLGPSRAVSSIGLGSLAAAAWTGRVCGPSRQRRRRRWRGGRRRRQLHWGRGGRRRQLQWRRARGPPRPAPVLRPGSARSAEGWRARCPRRTGPWPRSFASTADSCACSCQIPWRHLQRLLVLLHGSLQVAEGFAGLRQEAARQDVVGCLPKRVLELGAGSRRIARVQERPAERQPRRGIGGMLGQPGARHPDRLDQLPVLPQLLGQLREEAGTRVALEATAQLVDAGVSHGQVVGPARGYHRW